MPQNKNLGRKIPAALARAQDRALKAGGRFTEGRIVAAEFAADLSDTELSDIDIVSAEAGAPAGLAGSQNRAFQPEDLEREQLKRQILRKAQSGPSITPLHIPGGSMHELVSIDEGSVYGDRVVSNPCGSDEHSGAIQGPESKRGSRPRGYGFQDQLKNSPLDETLEHQLEDTSR